MRGFQMHKTMQSKWEQLQAYLCFDPKKYKMDALFIDLRIFKEQYEVCRASRIRTNECCSRMHCEKLALSARRNRRQTRSGSPSRRFRPPRRWRSSRARRAIETRRLVCSTRSSSSSAKADTASAEHRVRQNPTLRKISVGRHVNHLKLFTMMFENSGFQVFRRETNGVLST